ncbi:hypothetical protein [Treponema sp.]|uniref:hypothetical protein n=1 Tax=Treponema sp. TaxID=166 RepID=UPI00298E7C5C|nr:hypothetical protein [Treponema sp.]
MKNKLIYRSALLILCSLMLFSCSKKTSAAEEDVIPEKIITTHKWYCFTATDFEKIKTPEDAPKVIKKPYTESIRVSGIGQTAAIDEYENKNTIPKAYALINHLGVMELNGEETVLHTDKLIFKDFTADGIVFMNSNPVFSLYKDAFFNETLGSTLSSHSENQDISVLVQYDTKANAFFPIINTDSLKLAPTAQVTDYFWDGNFWYYCIKDSKENKTEFSYIKWNPSTALLSILPNDSSIDKETNVDKKTKISLVPSSESEFRKMQELKKFSSAPDRIKKLLSCLPQDFPFTITVKTAGGPSPRKYENNTEDQIAAEGIVQLSDSWVGAVFKDGTMYFSGALTGKRILNNSKPIALRLPKLPEGFIYTDFGISGDMLYVSWEESSFFETGRAGLLSVDLAQVIYNE